MFSLALRTAPFLRKVATPVVALTSASAMSASITTRCSGPIAPNPVWPSGVDKKMVESYVDEILADPSINIKCARAISPPPLLHAPPLLLCVDP